MAAATGAVALCTLLMKVWTAAIGRLPTLVLGDFKVLEDADDDRGARFAARHYADLPSLRHLHEGGCRSPPRRALLCAAVAHRLAREGGDSPPGFCRSCSNSLTLAPTRS